MTFPLQAEKIQMRLKSAFSPHFIEVINESHQHHTHTSEETHFKVILVSDAFIGVSRLKRHQAVYQCLEEVLKNIHALALHLFTTNEWEQAEHSSFTSPACRGGFDAN